jgi:hypothetical protein
MLTQSSPPAQANLTNLVKLSDHLHGHNVTLYAA